MDVQLDRRYPLPVAAERAWAVLADVHAVAGCMPGAQLTEQLDATHYKGTVRSKVGPAAMSFNGDLEVLGVDPAVRRMELLGKGADRSGSHASMNLVAQIEPGESDGASVLTGRATITVSGKLAQFGGRLLVPVADAMLTQFAGNFIAAAQAVPAPGGAPAAGMAAGAEPASERGAGAGAGTPPVVPPAAAPATGELNVLRMAWLVIKHWFAGLFGKNTA